MEADAESTFNESNYGGGGSQKKQHKRTLALIGYGAARMVGRPYTPTEIDADEAA